MLIHGIGNVRDGDVIAAAVKGIQATLPEVTIPASEERLADAYQADSSLDLRLRRLRWRDSRIDLVEFPWAGIAGKIRLRRPLRAIRQITGVIREFPSMAVTSTSSKGLRILAAAIGYTLATLWLLWMAAIVGSVIELAARTEPWVSVNGNLISFVPVTAELFTPGSPWFLEHSYYWSYAASWVVLAVEVLAVGLAEAFVVLFLISLVFPSLRPLNILIRTSSASGFVAFLFCIVLMYAHAPAADYIARVVGGAAIRSLVVIGIVFFVLVCAGFLVALWPANLLRDVVHYLGTSAGGARLADQQAIHDRLQRLIDALRGSPALNRIVLVCHSLGTVVVADFLLAAGRDRGRRVTVDLITAGSPVRRLINFLLPNRLPGPLEIRARLNAGTLPVERWFNAYRIADYVGTRLVPFRTDCSDPYTGIRECPLQPRWNWPWGHANYWADPRFVRLLAAEVLAPVIRADRRGFSSEVS